MNERKWTLRLRYFSWNCCRASE